jgi:hypothetical protein
MERVELLNILATRQWAKNLYVSPDGTKWPMVLTTENDPAMQQALLTEFGGAVEQRWDGRTQAGQFTWVVQHGEAMPLIRDIRPQLKGWRADAADVWLARFPDTGGHRNAVADIYP